MGLKCKTVWGYKGMFEKCHFEPCIHGWSVFDSENNFVGAVFDQGFAINSEYEYHDEIIRQLVRKGITVFDFDTHEEVKHETLLDEVAV